MFGGDDDNRQEKDFSLPIQFGIPLLKIACVDPRNLLDGRCDEAEATNFIANPDEEFDEIRVLQNSIELHFGEGAVADGSPGI